MTDIMLLWFVRLFCTFCYFQQKLRGMHACSMSGQNHLALLGLFFKTAFVKSRLHTFFFSCRVVVQKETPKVMQRGLTKILVLFGR